jgi:hypothetical protein
VSDAARLARIAYLQKPPGTPYAKFPLNQPHYNAVEANRRDAIVSAAFSATASYVEALSGIKSAATSWAIIKLYYSSFYSVRALLLCRGVVPFSSGGEMMLDLERRIFLKGGNSSHSWNWDSIRKTSAKDEWFSSQDSQDAYGALRALRENVNYTHSFPDPVSHRCLAGAVSELEKRFRYYRDDVEFIYTYLDDHLALSYPTKMLFEVDRVIRGLGVKLSPEQSDHLVGMWKFKDRCPMVV